MNLAATVNVVLYDRMAKARGKHGSPQDPAEQPAGGSRAAPGKDERDSRK